MILKIFVCLVLLSASSFAKNLDFSFSEWNFATYDGALASFDNGNVHVVNGGSDYWHVQLTRKNIELLNGKTYELRLFLQGIGVRRYVEIRIGRLNTIVHEIVHSFGLTDLYMDPADPSIAPDRYWYFAFDEGNIMAASIPSGERLRYRPLFVVNTGTNNRIPIGDGWFATENQWDCVRSSGKCFKQ